MRQPRKERIEKLLRGYELDYNEITTKLSEKDIPILTELVKQSPAALASRAVICLAWFASEESIPGIEFAAKSDNSVLRLTAARALSGLSNKPGAFELIGGLLDDNDIGVRKFALKTIHNAKIPGLKEKVRLLSLNDPSEHIRKLAEQVYDKLETPSHSTAG